MGVKRRILVSAPRDIRLDAPRIRIKRAIIDRIEQFGYEPQVFLDPTGGSGLAAGAGWSLEEVERVARRCVGAVIIRLPFGKAAHEGRECRPPGRKRLECEPSCRPRKACCNPPWSRP